MEHIITALSRRYPQLLLPIGNDIRHSEQYKNVVLRGEELFKKPDFIFSPDDILEIIETPAGFAEVLTLSNREDFEHCIRALAYRCEAREIPPTMGASTISGLINWEKIRRHQKEYLESGGKDWNKEFASFTSESINFRDTIIVLSRGYYSALYPDDAGYEKGEWLSLSHEIRKYHELAHFTSRRLFPDNKDAVRDEVLADMNGIIAALGHYDAELAGKFLGVIDGRYIPGGRLENYVPAEEFDSAVRNTAKMLDVLDEEYSAPSEPFEHLMKIEKIKLFL